MTFAASLAFTLFVGAAKYDATPEQDSMLRAQVVPLLEAYKATGDERHVREAVHRIMGPQWKPNNDFRRRIVELQNADLAASTARVRAAGLSVPAPQAAVPAVGAMEALRRRPPASAGTGAVVEGEVTDAQEAHE